MFRREVQKNMENMEEVEDSLIHKIDIELSNNDSILTIDYVPDDYGTQSIEVWVDRTVELNSLLGNFVCKERFGEFQYLKGPLTHAMENGITLILNNFEQISNELLVGIRTLAEEKKISHNQKKFYARGGFRLLGVCSSQKLSKNKSLLKNISHLKLPPRTVLSLLPPIANSANREYLVNVLTEHEGKYGFHSATKLWNRITRARKILLNE